jgi:phage tail-like protein
MAAFYYPPVNFHFLVSFENMDKNDAVDVMFQSVSGLDVQLDTEPIKEGGENRFEHVVPTRTKYSPLVLKRGKVLVGESEVAKWCKRALEEFRFEPKNILIKLLDEKHNALMTWRVLHAFPKSWKMSELNAEKGEALIETLELTYNHFIFQDA